MIRLRARPLAAPLPKVMLDWRHTKKSVKYRQLADGRGVGGGSGGGAESYDRKKAWSSINHSILSGVQYHSLGVGSVTEGGKWDQRVKERSAGQVVFVSLIFRHY